MKEDHFYVIEYVAVLHDDTPIMIFDCVKSKWSNRISKYSQRKCKAMVIYL